MFDCNLGDQKKTFFSLLFSKAMAIKYSIHVGIINFNTTGRVVA
jgi:hypothetical protein